MTDEPTQPDEAVRPVFSTPEMVEIQAEIATTRAELAATVDELAMRLNPRYQAQQTARDVRQLFVDPSANPRARRRALIVVGAAAVVTVVVTVTIVRKVRRRR
ncbi:MAG: DUF3618 domain-containing protein [Micrococcales bacterium]|nr:DUF3618 domain-containing protein [Micrococcales bacterium]